MSDSSENHTGMESCEEEEMVGGGKRAQPIECGINCEDLLAALTNYMNWEALTHFPPNVRRRIRALRSIQREFADIEAKFHMEIHELECKYEQLYKPLYEKRAKIVDGSYEPTDEECLNPWRDQSEEEELDKAVQNAAIADSDDKENKPMDLNVKGIPDFWYTIFKNAPMLSKMMQKHDEPILKCLQDIKVKMIKYDEFIGFALEFHFAPNEYFSNTVLTKEYTKTCKPDEEYPLEFEGPEICSSKGCEIQWKTGKNITVKTIEKHMSVQVRTFFNFFSSPTMPVDPNSNQASDIQALLKADFEIGDYFRNQVVARALLLYTREGLYEDDDDDDYYYYGEDSNSDENSGTEEVSEADATIRTNTRNNT